MQIFFYEKWKIAKLLMPLDSNREANHNIESSKIFYCQNRDAMIHMYAMTKYCDICHSDPAEKKRNICFRREKKRPDRIRKCLTLKVTYKPPNLNGATLFYNFYGHKKLNKNYKPSNQPKQIKPN